MVLTRRKVAASDGGGTRNAKEDGHGRGKEGSSTDAGELASPLASPSKSSSPLPALSPARRVLGLIFFAYVIVVSVFY